MAIVFATFNGEKTLPRMLEALCQLDLPQGGLQQVIAVDNASSDNTPQILHSFANRLPLLLLHQPERGKNRALNLAIPYIESDLVVFTDDDIIPDQNWLTLFECCANQQSDRDLFGGAILPYWEKTPDPWLLNAVPHGVTFGLTAPDLPEGPIYPGLIWGANMMVHKRVFDAGHRFHENVGPSAGQYIMGSETEFNIRMVNHGYKTCFCPTARVRHIIRDFQMTEEWVIRRAYRFGRNQCYQDFAALAGHDPPTSLGGWLNCPKWMLRRAIQDTISGHWSMLKGDRSQSVTRRWDAAFYGGYIAQAQEFKKIKVKNI